MPHLKDVLVSFIIYNISFDKESFLEQTFVIVAITINYRAYDAALKEVSISEFLSRKKGDLTLIQRHVAIKYARDYFDYCV